jgi:hypothetical protein
MNLNKTRPFAEQHRIVAKVGEELRANSSSRPHGLVAVPSSREGEMLGDGV